MRRLKAFLAIGLVTALTATGSAQTPATGPPWVCASPLPTDQGPSGQTTETLTVLPVSSNFYRTLIPCAGWSRATRDNLVSPVPLKGETTNLLSLIHLSDVHIIDAESPMRIEFMRHRRGLELPLAEFQAAFRPQETMSTQVTEAMVLQLNSLAAGPVTGRAFDLAVSTGDSGDGHQQNELQKMIDLLNGGATITPASGDKTLYQGVQDRFDSPLTAQFWHPNPVNPTQGTCTADLIETVPACEAGLQPGQDKFQVCYCFPAYPDLLTDMVQTFPSTGLKTPWYLTYGNHDRLLQGNFPINGGKVDANPKLSAVATFSQKRLEIPAVGLATDKFEGELLTDAFVLAFLGLTGLQLDLDLFVREWTTPAPPGQPPVHRTITPDVARALWTEDGFMNTILQDEPPGTPGPQGHGFSPENRDNGTLYYAFDLPGAAAPILGVVMDTTNPGGLSGGSIDAVQFNWLEQTLIGVSRSYLTPDGTPVSNPAATDKLVILFSHHNSETLDNIWPELLHSDKPDARKTIDDLTALVHRFPNAILWLNGHTHFPRVFAHKSPLNPKHGFWEVTTPSLIDFPQMTRLVELTDNGNGTLSIFGTLVDHAAPADPSQTIPGVDPTTARILRLAAISRQLSANDPLLNLNTQIGNPTDRNVELLINAPFPLN